MRRLLSFFAALAVASLIAAPVSAAAAQSGWDTFSDSQLFNPCTGEVVDNGGTDHFVVKDGFAHDNVHYVGTGESSGLRYVGNNEIKVRTRPGAGGTFTTDFMVTVKLVSAGSAPNQLVKVSDQQVFDSSGNLISETTSFSFVCTGS